MTQNMDFPYRNEGWERDIYPMPSFPMLTVVDLDRSSRWYQDTLGFADVFTMRAQNGAPLLVHLRWCKFADVLMTASRAPQENPKPPRGVGITLNFAAFEVDQMAERVRAAGARILEGPVDRPWNARDLTVLDPDGYRLNFTAPLRPERVGVPTFDDVIAKVRKGFPT